MESIDFEKGELLLIDKPNQWTSFDVVKKLKFALKIKKIGHAGTLDPLATGLLIICTGKKTKEIESYQSQIKTYEGIIELGQTTPTYDAESEPNMYFETKHITSEMILQVAHSFIGLQSQVPPMYSALKVNGKRLHELARKGKEIEVKPREIQIYDFEIIKIDSPQVFFKITCSKGTYIRSIAHDFGMKCKSGAFLRELRRTSIGEYKVEHALSIQDYINKYSKEIKNEES